ncbi:sporulation protein YqfD [Lutibacter sp. B2]|nr:sporulation protein YqfD [Lutibacter sp. B2]
MLVVRIWNFFRGYVFIRIEGLHLEKFINYTISKGIYLWDIMRIDYTTLEAKIGLRGYKELRHIVKKSGCKVKIKTKIGYPFFLHRIKVRKMFMIGFIISIIMVCGITSFVWDMEITGNDKIPKEKIEEYISERGLKIGVCKYRVDLSDIENNMMIDIENLAWAGIHFKGTKVIVEIVENVNIHKEISKDLPCNIVAKKDGVIEKIIAKNGDALVRKGDVVKKGQELITGIINREDMDVRYVHGLGEVIAKTYYEENDKISLVKVKKVETGNKIVKRTIKIGNTETTLGASEIPYKDVIIKKTDKSLSRWRNIKIPVEIIKEEYYEAIKIKEKIDKSVAKKSLAEKMEVDLVKKMPLNVQIINKDIIFYEEGNIIKAKLTIEASENIGEQQEIIYPKEFEEGV